MAKRQRGENPFNDLIRDCTMVARTTRGFGDEVTPVNLLMWEVETDNLLESILKTTRLLPSVGDNVLVDEGEPFQGTGPATVNTHVAFDETTMDALIEDGFFDDITDPVVAQKMYDAFVAVDLRPLKFEHIGGGSWAHAGGLEEIIKGALKIALGVPM